MELGYASGPDMTMTAEQVLDQLRALTPAERLYVVERIVHEVAAEVTPVAPVVTAVSIWGDESDAEFEAFRSSVQRLRSDDFWRSGDAEDAH
jgi:hypothetical protein